MSANTPTNGRHAAIRAIRGYSFTGPPSHGEQDNGPAAPRTEQVLCRDSNMDLGRRCGSSASRGGASKRSQNLGALSATPFI